MLSRMLIQRLATLVRDLRYFLFGIDEPFMVGQALELREVNQAFEHAKLGEHDEAIAIFDRLIASNPNNHLYRARGVSYELGGKHDKAIADFNEAISLEARDFDSYLLRGRVWAMLREYERAVADFTVVVAGRHDAEAYSARGDAYVEMGRHKAALEDYERVISLRPDANAYVARGTAFFSLKRPGNAMNDFRNATQLDPAHTIAHLMLGNIFRAQNNHRSAIEEYTKVIALMPEVVDLDALEFMSPDIKSHVYELAVQDVGNAYCGRGFSRSLLGDVDGAHNDFSAAIQVTPGNANIYWVRALAYVERGEHAVAMQDLELAAELDGRSEIPHFIKAWSHFNTEEFDRTLQDCDATIEFNPNWSEPHCLRGMALMRLGDYEGAISDFGKAIEAGSESLPQGYDRNRGVSVSLGLGSPAAHAFRGLAYLLLEKETEGRKDISQAAEMRYPQSEIEEELPAILSNEGERKAIIDIVRSAMADSRTERVTGSRWTASKIRTPVAHTESVTVLAMSESDKPKTLSREEYIRLFRRLGFHDIRVGRTLKHREPMPSIYFNCRYGEVSFVAYQKDHNRYSPDMWDRIPPQKKKDARVNLMTIVPRAGKEESAFRHLLSGKE